MLALATIAACGSPGSDVSGTGTQTNDGFGTEALGVTLGDIIYLVGAPSGRCVGVAGGSTADQAALELQDCINSATQQLRLETADGYYVLRVVGSDRCLTVSGASTSAGAAIVQATCIGATSQEWSGADVGGAYRITSRSSGMAVDAYGAGTASGTRIIQWPENSGTNQQWRVVAASDVAGCTVTIATSGNGTTSPAPGTYTVQAGTTGAVTATPAGGYAFTGWSGSATGTANPLTVTVNGNMTLTANFAPAAAGPSISSFSPTSEAVGASVTISGASFSTTASSNTVKFNGTTAAVTAATASSLTVTVPSGATTGRITVTVGGATATSASDFTVVGSPPGGFYTWPVYNPSIAYDYADEYGTIPPPASVANDCSGVAGTYTSGWWTFRYGARKNSLVTSAAWVPMLQRFNTDFSYITDVMRWPRDGRARSGNYSAIYLYGSGLCTDSASNTETGGWQSWVGNGPIVLASYYPVYSFDPACPYSDKVAQQGAMIHEGIHSILATMPGAKNACWFQEGGNTWLQATMEARRSGTTPTEMGWLSAGAAIAPFMPIETYSGWLQDGSFGGPCAERVNMFNSSGQQICTWRRLLGGTQYGEAFPHAMEVILGEKSVAWIWRYCQASGRVLQDLAEVSGGLGPTQTRRLIQEYRARQAFGDFGKWSTAYKKLLNDNWNVAIGPEWSPYWINAATWNSTCYAATTQSGSTLTPEERTLPGWSGANQIPLTVSSGATSATVTFNPTGANMSCQLVYRDTSGNIRYGTPVASGACSIPLSSVKDNVVVAVIANTNYVYDGGTTKYGYTLTLGNGVTGKAAIYTQWYK